jgi:hypothetical protein
VYVKLKYIYGFKLDEKNQNRAVKIEREKIGVHLYDSKKQMKG